MGKAAAPEIARGLIGAGMNPETPVALVESASCAEERRLATSLRMLPEVSRSGLGDGPALLLVGEAMGQSGAR
jgi:uroporphyrin-III C-methyltransferase